MIGTALFRYRGFFADPRLQATGEFLIDLEEDRAARAIVTTELRIMNRQDS
jgi:hypothetical protein